MKVAIYCRVSTDEQDVDKQRYICEEYCKRNNYEIFKVYKDVYSGAKETRPAFNKLINDMREFKFSCIMVSKLDRIGRSLQHLLSLFDEFNRKKIQFISTTQNIDTTSSVGKLQLHIMGAFAEYERNIISERTKEGLRRATGVGKRGKDKKPRKRRKDKVKRNIQVKNFYYERICKRCNEKYKTPRYGSKVCKNCRGGVKDM
jgi:DNA invertase Pin-like site-specific DNA recombinase|tara:strand:- start:1811 stop:2416 length:606 start_codon:yes stop_codon:yes gene_type:complete